jgi:rhodanese-related sulfurtransferase
MFGRGSTDEIQLTVQEVQERLNGPNPPKLLDVRQLAEYEIAHLPGAILATEAVVNDVLQNWDKSQDIVCVCHHGIRSLNAAQFLRQQGFTRVRSMKGGLDAWSLQIDPRLPRY